MGRSKSALINQQCIPLLELVAAVLGVRLIEFIRSSLGIPLSFVTFWTDSSTKLTWNKSVSKQKTFVLHQESSRTKEVKTVATQTRRSQFRWSYQSLHLNGKHRKTLAFTVTVLLLPQKVWVFENPPSQETNNSTLSEVFVSFLLRTYSTWTKLLGVVAKLYQEIRNFKDRAKTAINAAQRKYLFRCSQKSLFPEQLEALSKRKTLGHKDKVLALRPFLNDDGLIRAFGGLTEAPSPWATNQPFILNSDDQITHLFNQHCHEVCMHADIVHVRNFIQQPQYIFDRTCFKCRHFRGQGLHGQSAFLQVPTS